ncbi:MAG: hypothetical protein GX122_03320 [Candidatus Cloacimonetes bacterium]|nr:hypothetical protein [Candidatus Cloacimonadota bacterium]
MIHPDKIQLLFFFLISYLLSRVFVRFEVPRSLVRWLIVEKHITISRLSWLIIFGTTIISMLIANVVTLMAMIPVLELIHKQFNGTDKEHRKFATLMVLSAVWGANIGGIGMLTGTTTNGILVMLYEQFHFPISSQFTFLSWMTWAMPLALLLCVVGWLILMLVFRPAKSMQGGELRSQLCGDDSHERGRKISLWLAPIFLLSAASLSSSMSIFRKHQEELLLLSAVWMLGFLYLFFLHPFRLQSGEKRQILLPWAYIWHDLPRKGLLWVLAGVAITTVLVFFNLHKVLAHASLQWITSEKSALYLLLIVGGVATFATELMSNSVVQIAMFGALFPITKVNPNISWQVMLVISLTSTCAFMSPIATPSNGLGFGSLRKISLPYMLFAGLLMNLGSLMIISLWVHYVVPIVLCLFA